MDGIGRVLIGREDADHVAITVMRSEVRGNPWLPAEIEVRAGPWTGSCAAEISSGELPQLSSRLQKLYRDLAGTVKFEMMQPYLNATFTGDGKGHIRVTGRAQDLRSEATLTFFIDIDQTDLREIIAQLRAADGDG